MAEGELRAVGQVEVLAGVLVGRVLGPAAGADGVGDRNLADVARPGDRRGRRRGRSAPVRRAATAWPASLPGNQQATTAAAFAKTSGMAIGRPENSRTTAGLPVASTAAASSACRPGRSMRARLAASPLIQAASPRQRIDAVGAVGGRDGGGDAGGVAALDRDARDVLDGGVRAARRAGRRARRSPRRRGRRRPRGRASRPAASASGPISAIRPGEAGSGRVPSRFCSSTSERAAASRAAARRAARRAGVSGIGAGAAAVGVVEEAEAVLEVEDAGDGGVDGGHRHEAAVAAPPAGRSGRRATSCRCRRRRSAPARRPRRCRRRRRGGSARRSRRSR